MGGTHKELRELLKSLADLGFKTERTKKNHIKATAPNGDSFIFSVGGAHRTRQNQKSMLEKWKRAQTQKEEEVVKVVVDEDRMLSFIEQIPEGLAMNEKELISITGMDKNEWPVVIKYLLTNEFLEATSQGSEVLYRTPENEMSSEEIVSRALEAMVETVMSLAGGKQKSHDYEASEYEYLKARNIELEESVAHLGSLLQIKEETPQIKEETEDLSREVDRLKALLRKILKGAPEL